jgi:hypothetical protein
MAIPDAKWVAKRRRAEPICAISCSQRASTPAKCNALHLHLQAEVESEELEHDRALKLRPCYKQ